MIRTATPDDLASITKIYRDAVLNGTATYELEPPSLEEMQGRFEALRARGYPFLVATDDDGTVLGDAYAGLGTALMRALIEEVRELGFRQFVAVIGDGTPDSPSVRLHEKLGFRHTGKLEGSGYKHGRWLDTTFMQLEMNGGANQPPDPGSWPEKALKDG
jgi:phosphinothricin acetyltransferase